MKDIYAIIFQPIEINNIWKESQKNNIKKLATAAAEKAGIPLVYYADDYKIVIASTDSRIESVGENAFNDFSGELQMSELINLSTLKGGLKEEISQLIEISSFR